MQYGNDGLQKISKQTNKNLTTNNIRQHAAETLWLLMHKIKYFLKIVYLGFSILEEQQMSTF